MKQSEILENEKLKMENGYTTALIGTACSVDT